MTAAWFHVVVRCSCPVDPDGPIAHDEFCELLVRRSATHPTDEDLCSEGGHIYAGDDSGRGRCYCGKVDYPIGGVGSARLS